MTELKIHRTEEYGEHFQTWLLNNSPEPGDVIRSKRGPILVVKDVAEMYTDESRGWVPRTFPYMGIHVLGDTNLQSDRWWSDHSVFRRVPQPLVEDFVRGLLHMVDNPGTTCAGVPGGFLAGQAQATRDRLRQTFCLLYANRNPTFRCGPVQRPAPAIVVPTGGTRQIDQGSTRGIIQLGASLKPDLSGGFDGFDTLRDCMNTIGMAWGEMTVEQREYVIHWFQRITEPGQ